MINQILLFFVENSLFSEVVGNVSVCEMKVFLFLISFKNKTQLFRIQVRHLNHF